MLPTEAAAAAAHQVVSFKGPLGTNTISYQGPDPVGDVRKMRQSLGVRCLLDNQDCMIQSIFSSPQAVAWLVSVEGCNLPYVVKRWPGHRVLAAAEQLAAEAKAAAMFAGQLGARDPTMCLPSHLEVIPECGAFTISVYAGQSLEQQLGPGGAVDLLSKEDRVEVARLVAAALMFVRHHNDTLPDGARMHRDIKPGNLCLRLVGGNWLPVVMDFGAWALQNKADFFTVIDYRAMDSTLAALDHKGLYAAAVSADGLQHQTHHTIDMHQTALCVLQTIYGCLPPELDPSMYQLPEQSGDFFKAWREYDLHNCQQVLDLPQDARGFVRWCTQRDPSARPQTGAEALQHPFLAGALQQLVQTAQLATEEWVQAHEQLEDLLGSSNTWSPTPQPVPANDRSKANSSCGNSSSPASSTSSSSPCSDVITAPGARSSRSSCSTSDKAPEECDGTCYVSMEPARVTAIASKRTSSSSNTSCCSTDAGCGLTGRVLDTPAAASIDSAQDSSSDPVCADRPASPTPEPDGSTPGASKGQAADVHVMLVVLQQQEPTGSDSVRHTADAYVQTGQDKASIDGQGGSSSKAPVTLVHSGSSKPESSHTANASSSKHHSRKSVVKGCRCLCGKLRRAGGLVTNTVAKCAGLAGAAAGADAAAYGSLLVNPFGAAGLLLGTAACLH